MNENRIDVAKLEKLSIAGNAEAQFQLGKYYHLGRKEEPANYELAVHWYTKSATQGNAKAKTNLGILFKEGLGVPASMESAIRLWTEASTEKIPLASYSLGMAYLNGYGVEKSDEAAIAHLTEAADLGLSQAQLTLGKLYLDRKDKKAIALLQAAAGQGQAMAKWYLGSAYLNSAYGDPDFSGARRVILEAIFAFEEHWNSKEQKKQIGGDKEKLVEACRSDAKLPLDVQYQSQCEEICNQIEKSAWQLGERAVKKDYLAFETLFSTAATYSGVLMEIADQHASVVREFASKKLCWPVLITRGNEISATIQQLLGRIALGQDLPYDLSRVAFNNSPARDWCFCLINIVEEERILLRALVDKASDRTAAAPRDQLRARIVALDDLSPANQDEWFEVCWRVLLERTGGLPQRIPELAEFTRTQRVKDAESNGEKRNGIMKSEIKKRLQQTFPSILKKEKSLKVGEQ